MPRTTQDDCYTVERVRIIDRPPHTADLTAGQGPTFTSCRQLWTTRELDSWPWPPPTSRAPTASAREPYRELIELALGRGRNAMAIWQDLVDEHGFAARYASVRRFVSKLRGQRPYLGSWSLHLERGLRQPSHLT